MMSLMNILKQKIDVQIFNLIILILMWEKEPRIPIDGKKVNFNSKILKFDNGIKNLWEMNQ